MAELGLGIGRCPMPGDSLGHEVLSWYNQQGDRLLSEPEVQAQQIQLERARAERFAQRLRELGEEV